MTKQELEAARIEAWKADDWQLAAGIQRVLDKMNALVDSASRVRDRLARLVEGFTTEGVALDCIGYSVNTIGEIQGSGSEVDRLCGELGMALDILKEVKHDRADATKAEHVPTPAGLGEAAARQDTANKKPKTYATHDRKGRKIRVTIPED